ncbi:hypothetical protein LTR84_001526 [Exophiala bonariae]|uniref:Uncharacterized protein n=1 Tax=Exophiala bonariae TaxID=1690606 RepID=A0AAV9NCV0_9EURO|nr:hypothetical protein LTR84_001526 [Exophiala bonariae]
MFNLLLPTSRNGASGRRAGGPAAPARISMEAGGERQKSARDAAGHGELARYKGTGRKKREGDFAKEKEAQDAQMQELNRQLRELQTQRDQATKHAQEAAVKRTELENATLELMIQRDRAAIAAIDNAIAERTREEQRIQHQRTQTVKESVFKHTMKVSMAESLVHGALRVAGHAISAVCVVL